MLESASGQQEGQIPGRVLSCSHAAAEEDHGVIKERTAVDRVFLRLEQPDKVRGLGDLVALDELQRGDLFFAFSMMGEAVVATAEAKVSASEAAGQGDGPG